MSRECSYPECELPHMAKGLCNVHYCRMRAHGEPFGVAEPRRRIDAGPFLEFVQGRGGLASALGLPYYTPQYKHVHKAIQRARRDGKIMERTVDKACALAGVSMREIYG